MKFADRDVGKDITLDDIMNERRKELFGEGQWWFCLKKIESGYLCSCVRCNFKRE